MESVARMLSSLPWRLCCHLVVLAAVIDAAHSKAVPEEHNVFFAPTSASYRTSFPKPQQVANRVPAHLQDIHMGFVYDDSDDVIHIIEPPQRFQLLKRHIYQQLHGGDRTRAEAAAWEQQRQVHVVDLPAALVNEPSTKVEKPLWPGIRRKSVTAAAKSNVGADLLKQETKQAGSGAQQTNLHFASNQLPVELLASVRQTERLQQQRRHQAPHAYQRLHKKQTHTLVMEKAYQLEGLQQGKERRMAAICQQHQHPIGHQHNRRLFRKRRELSSVSQNQFRPIMGATDQHEKRKCKKLQQENAKLVTRKQQATASFAAHKHLRPKRDVKPIRGGDNGGAAKLLQYLNELLRNVTYYLPNSDSDETSKAFSMRLIGEVQPRTEHLYKATYPTLRRCTSTENRLPDMDCIKSTPRDDTVPPPTAKPLFEQWLRRKIPRRLLSSFTTAIAAAPRSLKQRRGESSSELHSGTVVIASASSSAIAKMNSTTSTQAPTTELLLATLLYEDIMMNIRNTPQGRSLTSMGGEQVPNASGTPATSTPSNTAAHYTAAPLLVHVNVAATNAEFRDKLHHYLDELEAVVAHLQPPSLKLALNTPEFFTGNASTVAASITSNDIPTSSPRTGI